MASINVPTCTTVAPIRVLTTPRSMIRAASSAGIEERLLLNGSGGTAGAKP